jgi:uncharacterized protein (DUF486 family)
MDYQRSQGSSIFMVFKVAGRIRETAGSATIATLLEINIILRRLFLQNPRNKLCNMRAVVKPVKAGILAVPAFLQSWYV